MPNSKVGRVEERVHERVRPNFPAKSTWRECLCKFSACGEPEERGVWTSTLSTSIRTLENEKKD